MSSPTKVDKAYVLAHMREEAFHHRGRNVFLRGLPVINARTNVKTAVYGPGAAQWKIDARNYMQANAATTAAAAAAVPVMQPAHAPAAHAPPSAIQISQSAPAAPISSGPTPVTHPIRRLVPASRRSMNQLEVDTATFRSLEGTRPAPATSSSDELSFIFSSPELPDGFAERLIDTPADPFGTTSVPSSNSNASANANAASNPGRSARIRNIEAAHAALAAASPRPKAPLKKKRAPRSALPPSPSTRTDEDGRPYRSDEHTMMVEQFRNYYYPQANTGGGQLIAPDVGYAVPLRHQPDVARQAWVSPPPAGYNGPLAGQPTRIPRPDGNEDPQIRRAQVSMAEALAAFMAKEQAEEEAGEGAEEEGDTTLTNSDGRADEEADADEVEGSGEAANEQGERVIPDSDAEESAEEGGADAAGSEEERDVFGMSKADHDYIEILLS